MLSNSSAQTQAEGTPLSFGSLPLQVVSEDEMEYEVKLIDTDYDSVERLYNNVINAKESLSPVGKVENKKAFIARIFSSSIVILSIKVSGEECGIAYINNIVPAYSAEFNFIFWDRKMKGRQRLILSLMKWFEDEFLVRRFELRYHALAFYALHRIYKLGAFYEGTKRKAWRYEDKIIDLHIFSILASELTQEAIDKAFVHRSPSQRKWYAKLAKGGSNA